MATEVDKILVRIETDLAGLKRGLDQARRQVDGTTNNMSKSFGGIKTAIAAVGAALATLGIGVLATNTIRASAEMEDLEKANKLENFEKFIYTNGINFYKLNNSHHNLTNLTYKKQLSNHPTYYHIDTTLDDNDTNIKDKTKVVYSMTQNLTWSRVSEDNCSC